MSNYRNSIENSYPQLDCPSAPPSGNRGEQVKHSSSEKISPRVPPKVRQLPLTQSSNFQSDQKVSQNQTPTQEIKRQLIFNTNTSASPAIDKANNQLPFTTRKTISNIDMATERTVTDLMIQKDFQAIQQSQAPKIKKSNTVTQLFLNSKNNSHNNNQRGIKVVQPSRSGNSQIPKGALQEPVQEDVKLRENVTTHGDELLTSIMEATSENEFRTTENQFANLPQAENKKDVNEKGITEEEGTLPSSIRVKNLQIDYSKIMLTLSLPAYVFNTGNRSSTALGQAQSPSPSPFPYAGGSSNYNSQKSPSQKSVRKGAHTPSNLTRTTTIPDAYFKSKYLRINIIEQGEDDEVKKKLASAGPPSSSRTIDLSNFKNLIVLNISNCGLRSINTLKRSKDSLRFLNASDNFLQSGFPHLPKVEQLYLARNQFKSTDYLSKCKKVKVLDISYNLISDSEQIYRVGRELDDLCAVRLEGNPIKTKDKWLLNSTVFGKHVNCTPTFSEITLDFSQWSKCMVINQSPPLTTSTRKTENNNLEQPLDQQCEEEEQQKIQKQQSDEQVIVQINDKLYGGRNEIIIRQRLRKALNYLDIMFGDQINQALREMRQDDDINSLFTGGGLSELNTSNNMDGQDSINLIPYKSQKPMLKTQIDKLCEFRIVMKNAVGLANEEPIQDAISRVIGQNIAYSQSPQKVKGLKNQIRKSNYQRCEQENNRRSYTGQRRVFSSGPELSNSNNNQNVKTNACINQITTELIRFQNLTHTNQINQRRSIENQGDSPLKTDSRLDISDYRRLTNRNRNQVSSSFNFDVSPGLSTKNESMLKKGNRESHKGNNIHPQDLFKQSFMDTSNPPSLFEKAQLSGNNKERREIKQQQYHQPLSEQNSRPSTSQSRMIKYNSVSELLNNRKNCYSPSQSTKSIMKRVNKVLIQAKIQEQQQQEKNYEGRIYSQSVEQNDQRGFANTTTSRELNLIQENIKAEDMQSNPTILSTPR